MVVSRHEAKTFTLYLKEYVMFRSRLGLTGHVLLISGALVCMLLISRETVLTTDEMLSLRGGNTCYKLETVPCFPTPYNPPCAQTECTDFYPQPGVTLIVCPESAYEVEEFETTYQICDTTEQPPGSGRRLCPPGQVDVCWGMFKCESICNNNEDEDGRFWCPGVSDVALDGWTYRLRSLDGNICP
jgi:hypothetical protein